MTYTLCWTREGSTLRLSGMLDQNLLTSLWRLRFKVMQGVTLIDLKAINHIDTAGIALLLHLVETGKKQGGRISLTGINDDILLLAKLYNLPENLLPF